MDLLHGTATDVFCIVSSDSDFTRLAMRLREAGKRVYGFGARTAAVAFRNACDRYTYLDLWTRRSREDRGDRRPGRAAARRQVPAPSSGAGRHDGTRGVGRGRPAVARRGRRSWPAPCGPRSAATAQEDGWASLARVGRYIVNTAPDRSTRAVHGYPSWACCVGQQRALEVEARTDAHGHGR